MPFHLSPSRVARYFYHECDRYLRYHATAKSEKRKSGIPDTAWDTVSPATKIIIESGYAWEEEVIRTHLNGNVRIAKGNGRLCERTHNPKDTLALLISLQPDEAIYQPTLVVPKTFYTRYGLDPGLCKFPPCRPDLIRVIKQNGRTLLRIIDIKASSALKANHRIQTALYTLILKEIISHDTNLSLDTEKAGIWLYGQETPEWFDLQLNISAVEQFIAQRLNPILTASLKEVPWHLFFRCEWCDFYEYCREEAENLQSVSLIPYLSVGGRRYLREGIPASVNSLKELGTFLNTPDSENLLECCGSLRGKKTRLQNALTALQENEVIPHGGSSLALPINEHVSIVMTVHDDPVSGEIYAAGFRRLKGKSVYKDSSRVEIFIAQEPRNCTDIQQKFLTTLFEELKTLHDYNAEKQAWKDQKSLQVYVFDGYERTLFNRLLLDAIRNPELAPVALQMLFHFQDPALTQAEEHPETEVPFPVIVATSVIRRLVALPLPLSLRLPEVLNILPSPNFAYSLEPDDLFWFNLSNRLKSDAIFQAWYDQKPDAADWIHGELKRRLIATHTVIDGLRDKVADKLFAWSPKFSFPGALSFQNPELSRLAFVVRYESFMGATNQREARTQPYAERVRSGVSIPLKLSGANRWEVLSELDSTMIETNDFPSYIIVPKGEGGERDQMAYNDFWYRRAMYTPKDKKIRLTSLPDMVTDETTGRITHLCLSIRNQNLFAEEDEAVLHPRFTDFTSDRIINRIGTIDTQPDNDFLKLIKNPSDFARRSKIPSDVKKLSRSVLKKTGFTPSQQKAFEQFLTCCLTLVWGPPGTGKTHFLAKAILCMAEIRKQQNRAFRVAVTAFTHAAIENLLEEIRENLTAFGLENSVSLCKLKYVKTPRGENLRVISEDELSYLLDEDILIVGGTVYSFQKADVEGEFPFVIVDEASQMKFGELSLGMIPLSSNGRLMLAGDDLQLPPIINGQYPDPEDGLPGLHDSVFAYLRARDGNYTFQLQENWRMNKTLSLFPAKALYGEKYKPVNDAIGNQRLDLKPLKSRDRKSDFFHWITHPDYPLVIGILEDVQATVANPTEAKLVAGLSFFLRKTLMNDGTLYPDSVKGDKEFWRKGLFIVSPHHAQIRLIRKELALLKKWQSPPFVDTVDKMQGQQCRSVIVSYGVSDTETAFAEAEFIYSLNRLNVSVTRAQSKCMVFLPRPLIEPSFDVLQNEKAAKGLAHMHALEAFCKEYGESENFSLNFSDNPCNITVIRASFLV